VGKSSSAYREECWIERPLRVLWLECMTVEAIKEAIAHLSEQERKHLSEWFEEMEDEAWDRQMEQDFAPGGRGAHLLENIDRQIEAGNFTSLEEGLRRRREQQSK
jgi:hypothetical protein